MNRRVLTSLVGLAALLLAVGCNQTATTTASGGKPLIAEPTTGVTFSEDFNPYDTNSVAASMGTRTMVNEPLVEFDQLDATAAGTHPWLATAYTFQNGGKDLQVTIRQNVKFSDGSSFGPADVAATFKMLENPKADVTGVPPQASDPTVSGNTVTLHFNSAQYTGLFPILGNTYILKGAIASQIAQNPTMTIKVPLGTGPFMLDSYSSSVIKWKPNPNYWGGTPPESAIWTPSIATNAAASDALISGQLDWAGNDIPNVYANYVNLNPLTNHAWFAAGSTVTLWFNLNSGNGGATANCWTKGGKIIKFSVYDPVPFSDYWENAALMSQELQPLGMDVTTKPAQGYSDWNTNITSQPANWQTAIHWGNGGAIPYIQFQNWFDSKDANSVAHYQGWSSADADAALRQYESTDPSDTATLYPIVQKLEKIMSTEVPDAPLLYGADWNVFSSSKYTGWPNQSHPYMNPSPSDPQMPYILMQLKPATS